ncbi:branched-chain amino acid transport system II carrier protein [Photobacterium makurazakiensis]|uniref:branched-chain amino acid transport system II carrier protein n=1 Tax=Photobacterium makurazakiensis TaxID=2910234 RepID=UPI003D0EC6B7
MKKTELIAIGFMTFALFLGAGNLIFPPLMAQQAGENWLIAIAGFLVTAVGIPTLSLVVLGKLPSMHELTAGLPRWMDRTFWIATLTTLGPAFVLPRAVTVAYEMGIKPFVYDDHLFLFSISFCVVSLMFALKPGKMVDYIGKIMTPAMIVMLSTLVIAALLNPLGTTTEAVGVFKDQAGVNGVIQGYMTLDGVASVAFGWVIIRTIRSKGVTKPSDISRYSNWVAVIYAVLMSICYVSMGYLGATSSDVAINATNGGEILTLYAAGEFGTVGQLLLAVLTIVTCLSTVVGLTNANSEYYNHTFGMPMRITSIIIIALTAVVSNVGLETIIELSLPVILILCPIAVTLIVINATLPKSKWHSISVGVAALFGGVDTLNILGMMPEGEWTSIFPLYNSHMSWLLPVLAVILTAKLMKYKVNQTVSA